MSRRRVTLRAYLRRRWRAVGLLAVLFLGALLILLVTDRGHDPLWEARSPVASQVAIAPDGSEVYVLVRESENGPFVRLEAHDGETGATLWRTDMNDSRAIIAATDRGVAVVTDFPRAFATFYTEDGIRRYQVPLEGGPRAVAAELDVVAVALQSPLDEDQVLVIEDGRIVRAHAFAGLVNALDLRAEHLAVGTSAGEIARFGPRGELVNATTIDLDILSIRLSADATELVAGGYERDGTSFAGGLAFVGFEDEPLVEWIARTDSGVGLVGLDAAGERAIAVEESAPGHRLRVYDTRPGVEVWAKRLAGVVARDEAGHGGVGISSDGATVVVGTIYGALRAYDGATGSLLWTYGSEGTTVVSFRETQPSLFAANARLVPNGPLEAALLFSPEAEPIESTVAGLAAAIGVALVVGGVLFLGIGYWRLRRQAY